MFVLKFVFFPKKENFGIFEINFFPHGRFAYLSIRIEGRFLYAGKTLKKNIMDNDSKIKHQVFASND